MIVTKGLLTNILYVLDNHVVKNPLVNVYSVETEHTSYSTLEWGISVNVD